MSRTFAVILLPLVFLPLMLGAQETAQAVPGAVEGKVTDSQTGNGISGATLHLYARGPYRRGGSALATASQGDGTFRFESVPSGNYFVVVNHSGYTISSGRALTVTVNDGQQVSDVAVELQPLATVSGKVLDENARAVPGATVQLFRTYNYRGKAQLQQVQTSDANSQGEYVIKNVNPGNYYLSAEPQNEEASSPESAKNPEGPIRTFYPNAQELEGAGMIEVRAAQVLADANIRLRHGLSFHVRGRTEAVIPGSLVGGATLSLAPRGSLASDGLGRRVKANQDGTFDIDRVQPGSYTLWLTGRYAPGAEGSDRPSRQRLLARQDVDVSAGSVDDVVLALMPSITLSGQITIANGPPQNLAQIRVNLVPAGPVAFGGFKGLRINADGSFAVQGLEPGEYTVRVTSMPAGMYVKSVELNRQDVSTNGMDLSQGGSGELQITLRAGAAEVDGTLVSNGNGTQPVNGTALLVPDALADDGSGVLLGGLNSSGSFAIRNVPPGRYFAFAVDRWTSVWQNPEFLRDMQRQGTAVDVQENGTLQLHLPVLTADQIEPEAARLGLSVQ